MKNTYTSFSDHAKHIGAAALLATSIGAHAGETPVAKTIDWASEDVRTTLCKDMGGSSGIQFDSRDVCQVSPNGGKTWIWIPVGLLSLLGGTAAYMIRRKKAGVATPDAGALGVATHDATLGDVAASGEPLTVAPEEILPLETLDDANAALIAKLATDPRATLAEDGKLKTIKIGTIEYNMADWTPSSSDKGSFYNGDEEIIIDGSGKVTYLQERSDLDHNVTDSYANGTIVHFDNTGISTIQLKDGNRVIGSLDEFGEPKSGSTEQDASGNIVAHYNESGNRILGDGVSESQSELDILDIEIIEGEPAPAPTVTPTEPTPTPLTPAEGVKSPKGATEDTSDDTAIISAPVSVPVPAPVSPGSVPATTSPATQRKWWQVFKNN